jgi:hypothetical protein
MTRHDPPDRPVQSDDDVEGHAFKWDLVDDPKGGKRLDQGWNPNDPAPGKPQPRRADGPAASEKPR